MIDDLGLAYKYRLKKHYWKDFNVNSRNYREITSEPEENTVCVHAVIGEFQSYRQDQYLKSVRKVATAEQRRALGLEVEPSSNIRIKPPRSRVDQ